MAKIYKRGQKNERDIGNWIMEVISEILEYQEKMPCDLERGMHISPKQFDILCKELSDNGFKVPEEEDKILPSKSKKRLAPCLFHGFNGRHDEHWYISGELFESEEDARKVFEPMYSRIIWPAPNYPWIIIGDKE